MLDALVVIALSGGFASMLARRRVATTLLAAGILGALTLQHPAQAQSAPPQPPALTAQQEEFAMKATMQTHLAYIITGDADVDAVSKAGLQGSDAVFGAAHRAGSRRADRPRSGARRTRLFPADLLAGVGERARSPRRPRSSASTLT